MKKLCATLGALVLTVSFTGTAVFAGVGSCCQNINSVGQNSFCPNVAVAWCWDFGTSWNTFDVQTKIAELIDEKATLIEAYEALVAAHLGDKALKAKVEKSISKLTEKYDAAIVYYESLID